jgi:lipopolysaccharide heptosyltransferase I
MANDAPRILIVRLSAVGDVVHVLPALNALREAYPKAHIGWACHKGPANLLEGHPQVDRLIIIPRNRKALRESGGLKQLKSRIRNEPDGWDACIDFQGLAKSGLVTRLSKAPQRIGFAGKESRELNWLFMNRRIRPTTQSVILMNLELLAPLGVRTDNATPVLHHTPDDERAVREWAEDTGVGGDQFLFIDPFAGWSSKLWEQSKWIELACRAETELGLRSLIFFGPGEKNQADALAWAMQGRKANPVVGPDVTLRQYVALVRLHAKAMVAGDTGPMHIAAALGVPTVALFGSSDSRRNAPCFTGASYRTIQDFSQPCAGTFARTCRFHDPGTCLRGIWAAQALETLAKLLEETEGAE